MKITKAIFIKDYTLSVTFDTGETKSVDFSQFITENRFTFLGKYREEKNFKKFKIENGNIVWGKDWDLIFPVEQIYKGYIR